MRNRVEVMHGVNLSELGRRDPEHYGGISLDQLERLIGGFGRELGLDLRFFHTNHEGEFIEELHRLEGMVDGIVLNPGAWTHYSWAIHDALEPFGGPFVEVHLSNVDEREDWRRFSVLHGLGGLRVVGKGFDGYREALQLLNERRPE